jgi:WhiB family transcriptional regulator, redox-sensing transcriptional regulator
MSDWRHEAACRGSKPEAWFPISTVGEGLVQAGQAKAICFAQCSVRLECLGFAMETNCGDGIFGGLDAEERRALRRRELRARLRDLS